MATYIPGFIVIATLSVLVTISSVVSDDYESSIIIYTLRGCWIVTSIFYIMSLLFDVLYY